MLAVRLMQAISGAKTYLLNTNANDVNLFSIAGSPTVKGNWRFIVPAGVTIGNITAVAAMTVGQFPSGSVIDIFVSGSVLGKSGLGGVSGSTNVGGNGGHAIKADYLNQTVRIYNSGTMKAGGGGGGAGGTGGGGGNGGRGNISSTSAYEQPRSDVEWYIFDAVPNDNHVSWFGNGGNDSNGPGESLMVSGIGMFEKGSYWGHTQDANPHNSWYVRLHTLYPAGIGAPTNAGGQGGNGAGFNQLSSGGQTGGQTQVGSNPGNGAGQGGSSGNAGKGGDGNDWGIDGGVGNAGNPGIIGNAGVYEGGALGIPGGNPSAAGVGGSYLVKGSAVLVSLINTGTVVGKLT